MSKYNIASGQVYEWIDDKRRIVLDQRKEITRHGDEMWTIVGNGLSTFNVNYYLDNGALRLYSQNSLNA